MKGFRRHLAIIFTVMLTLLSHTNVLADDAVIGRTPAGVYPMMDSEIEMLSEDIIIDMDRNTVECTFVFYNTGEARDVLMGFPGKLREELGSFFSNDVSLSLRNFRAFANGKELPVEREPGIQPEIALPDYSEWFTFTVSFAEDEKVTVRNTYTYEPTYDSIGNVTTGYVLKTGAVWKGKIGKARVEFKLGSIQPWQIEQLKPGGFRFKGNSIVWERTNIEPVYDLKLVYNNWFYSKDYLAAMEANEEDASDILQKIEKYKEIKRMAEEMDEESLLAEYAIAAENKDVVLTAYIAGFLPNKKIPDDAPVLGEIEITPYGTAYHISCDVKSLYSPDVLMRITHEDEGNIVVDSEVTKASTYIILKPEFEYEISVSVKDWLDRTAVKTVRFKIPSEESGDDNPDVSGPGNDNDAQEIDESNAGNAVDNGNEGDVDKESIDSNGDSEAKEDGTVKSSESSETEASNDSKTADGTDRENDGARPKGAEESEPINAVQSTGDEIKAAGNTNYPESTLPKDGEPAKRSSRKTLYWIFGAVVALGCLAAGFFSYIRSKS